MKYTRFNFSVLLGFSVGEFCISSLLQQIVLIILFFKKLPVFCHLTIIKQLTFAKLLCQYSQQLTLLRRLSLFFNRFFGVGVGSVT